MRLTVSCALLYASLLGEGPRGAVASVQWNVYRLGDYFYGNPKYVNIANRQKLRGTILDEYRSLATSNIDLKALVIAVEDVCKHIAPHMPQAEIPHLPGTNYAAVHLRIGDVMSKAKYKFTKHVPAPAYEIAAAELVAAGVTAVDLYYLRFWGIGKHKQDAAAGRTERYIATVTSIFKKAGIITVNKAPDGNADQDLCAMLKAPFFVMAGGGYSRLIRSVRAQMGDTFSSDFSWWCSWLWGKARYSEALNSTRRQATKNCGSHAKWLTLTGYWHALEKEHADVNTFNWTEIEENLDQTLFVPNTMTDCFRDGVPPPIFSNGTEFHGHDGHPPEWPSAVCCKLPEISAMFPIPRATDICAKCVDHDHYCSSSRWRCETHCQMQFCESGVVAASTADEFQDLLATIKNNGGMSVARGSVVVKETTQKVGGGGGHIVAPPLRPPVQRFHHARVGNSNSTADTRQLNQRSMASIGSSNVERLDDDS